MQSKQSHKGKTMSQDQAYDVDKCGATHTSSPSLRTMVPARSTTAKTMTAQSSLLTDMVMFANAGSWCMNSSNCSVWGGEERRDSRVSGGRLGRKTKEQTESWHPEEREREDVQCSWPARSRPHFQPRRHELQAEHQNGSSPQWIANRGIIIWRTSRQISIPLI